LLVLLSATAAAQNQDHVKAEAIVQAQCFLCHGLQGEGASPLFPRLAAQNAQYLARQLADYQSGRRKSSSMQPMVAGLSAADFNALGAFFAAQPAQIHEEVLAPELLALGRQLHLQGLSSRSLPACASCHGEQAQGSAQLPRLAGQHARYLENQLRMFHTRERTNDNGAMHELAGRLGEREIKAVAGFLAALK
jgi:cytochrome c553